MPDKKVLVYIELNNTNHFVGTLWSHFIRGKETSEFEYSKDWLNNKNSFSLQPSLLLSAGKQINTRNIPLFGAFGDSAPDSWGRLLMKRYEVQKAKQEKRAVRTLQEIDYLLYVNDFARQGALRFKTEENGEFLFPGDIKSIPPLVKLSELLNATEKVISLNEKNKDLEILMAPGSSLGGARPKASVIDKTGNLCIAKFPKKDDYTNNVIWEAVALELAKKCGLNTQEWKLEKIKTKHILIAKRFDRIGTRRIPFLSAMSMLNAIDNDYQNHSYLEIADALRLYGATPKQDLFELWKRIVFFILISNTDDHLRNHGFVYNDEKGWRLAPLYDVNPSNDNKNMLNTFITENDNSQNLELALEICDYFGIKPEEAKKIIEEMKKEVQKWNIVAKKYGLSKYEIEKMEPAFKYKQI